MAASAVYCDSCGAPAGAGDHARCAARRAATDPPRFCPGCGRRLAVQVLPLSWSARCVRCGPLVAEEAPRGATSPAASS